MQKFLELRIHVARFIGSVRELSGQPSYNSIFDIIKKLKCFYLSRKVDNSTYDMLHLNQNIFRLDYLRSYLYTIFIHFITGLIPVNLVKRFSRIN